MVTAVLSSEENQPAQAYVNAERKKITFRNHFTLPPLFYRCLCLA